MKGFIKFPAYYKNGQLLDVGNNYDEPCDIPMDADKVRVIGEGDKPAWSNARGKIARIRGMFIAYDGDEYGTIDWDFNMTLTELNGVRCCKTDMPRLHVKEFAIQFE